MTSDPATAHRPRGRPTKSSGESGRQRLLEVARLEFARKGYAGTSVDELVLMADVTTPTLYHHFGNKLGLFLAAAKDVYDRTLSVYRAAVADKTSFREATDALIDASATLMREEPTLAMMISTMQFELRRDPDLHGELRPLLHQFREFFDQLAERAPLALRPTPQQTRAFSHLLVAIISGIENEGLLLSRNEDIDNMLEALRRLIRTAST